MPRHRTRRRKNKPNRQPQSDQTAERAAFNPKWSVIVLWLIGATVVIYLVWNPLGTADQATRDHDRRTRPDPGNSGAREVEPTEKDVAAQLERLNPRVDGWDAEIFEQAAGSQLKRLGKQLAHRDALDVGQIRQLQTDDFRCTPLRPEDLGACFSDNGFTVYRPSGEGPSDPSVGSLADAGRKLVEPFHASHEIRVKFKIFFVELGGSSVTTVSYYQATGLGSDGPVQQLATWRCTWTTMTDGERPALRSIQVEQFEEVVGANSSPAGFADCTTSLLGANRSYHQQLLYGIDYWRQRLPKWSGLHYSGHHGLAIGDVNGDDLDDIYICRPGCLPNRLYVQNADGTATDKSAAAGVDWLDYSTSALIIDLDNDGDQDLAAVLAWGVVLMSNNGKGQFVKRAAVPVFEAMTSMSASDFDLDGDLDIYVCVNGGREDSPLPYHDANNGGRNVMLRNEGEWRFVDATEAVGLDVNNLRYSFAASWEDYDSDGDPDLYVANDYGRNNLYQNNGGRFVDVAAKAGVEDIAAGMSVDWADYNGDGLMDLYVSNMFSSAGSRVTYQRRFKSGESDDLRSDFQRHARGNSLFENAGDGTFRDVSVEARVTMGRWAWSSNFIDLNNDGREDIFVANGYVTQEDTDDL